MRKKLSVLLALVLLMGALAVPASAAAPETVYKTETIYVEGLGEVEVETVTTVHDSLLRSSKKTVETTDKYKSGGTVIATVTLKATFGYDGSDAWVESASVTKSTSGGWSYGGQSIDKDGGTVTLTAKLTKSSYPSIPVEITMTCSPSGKIS